MDKRLSIVLPLVLITLGCVVAVEAGRVAVLRLLTAAPAGQKLSAPAAAATAGQQRRQGAGPEVIVARNLFAAAQPARQAAGAEGERAAALATLVLMGTVDETPGPGRAIFLDTKTGRQQLYRRGERVAGAVLEEVGRGRAILASGGRREVFDLREAARHRVAVRGGGMAGGTVDQKVAAEAGPEAGAAGADKDEAAVATDQDRGAAGGGARSFRLQRAAGAKTEQ